MLKRWLQNWLGIQEVSNHNRINHAQIKRLKKKYDESSRILALKIKHDLPKKVEEPEVVKGYGQDRA